MHRPKYLYHTLNTSPSKEAHSFGNEARFIYNRESPRNHHLNPQHFKTITFAKNQKEKQNSPSPTSYNIPSQFDKKKGKGYSFGRIINQKSKMEKMRTSNSPNRDKFNMTRNTDYIRQQRSFKDSLNKSSIGIRMYDYNWKGDKYGYYSPDKNSPGPGSYTIFSCFGDPDDKQRN